MTETAHDGIRHRRFFRVARFLNGLFARFGLELVDAPDSAAWRWAAVKESEKQRAIDAAALLDSLARIREAGTRRRRFAVIAPMPPAETGIANATVQTFC